MKPNRHVSTWTTYRVNGLKFHIEARSVGMKTYDRGVGMCGTREGDIKNDYYDVLRHFIETEYQSKPLERCVLFNYEWLIPY